MPSQEQRLPCLKINTPDYNNLQLVGKYCRPQLQPQLRGKIRDITPEDLGKIVDYDEPTFIRQKRAVGESSGAVYRGTGGTLVSDSDLDVPTFLRRKAD